MVILEPYKNLWQTSSSLMPTAERTEKRYPFPSQNHECFYLHPIWGPLVMTAVNEKVKWGWPISAPKYKDAKKLDLFGRKMYSSSGLQFKIANHQALLAHFDYSNWASILKFMDKLLDDAKVESRIQLTLGCSMANSPESCFLEV